MSNFNKQVTVHYTAEQMYNLINDINAYSSYIPLCIASEVHEELDHKLRATIKIAKGKIGFEFTTVNTMEKNRSIRMSLENGPFKSLMGIWSFTPLGEQDCIISLNFDFDFSNKFLDVALSGLFKQLCNSMVESFRKQAALLYDWNKHKVYT